MAKESANSAKQRAAEARAAAEAAEKRRKRTINLAIFGVLAIVVIGLVGGAYLASKSAKDALQPSPDAAIPQGVYPASDAEYKYGIPLAKAAANKPVLELWEDFQCPACGQFEATLGPTVAEIAKNGDATVIWRSTSFLDNNLGGDHSKLAAAAWGCAVDAGKSQEFHDIVFANQPAQEGDGWTDQQLMDFAAQAGITGDAKAEFDQCLKDRKYLQWAVNGTATMAEEGVGGTPGVYINGVEVPAANRQTPEDLIKAIEAAAKQMQKQS